jgi:hypothetical protein
VPSVVVNSGGGFHAYWLLYEPMVIDDSNRAAITSLQYRWVGHVGGDDVKDLARVLRLPGTRNVKSKYAPDFPGVEFAKCDLDCLYDLGELAAYLPPVAPVSARTTWQDPQRRTPTYTGDNPAGHYIQSAVADVECAGEGQLHYTLRSAACRLGRVVGAGLLSESEAESLLTRAVSGKARDMGGAIDTIRSGLALGSQNPFIVSGFVTSSRRDPYTAVVGRNARDPYTAVRSRAAQARS